MKNDLPKVVVENAMDQRFEHALNVNQALIAESREARQEKIRNFDTLAPIQSDGRQFDARRVQLLALFDMSDERGQALLLAIAGIHAARYPKVKA